jgi:hypothetical protein
MTPAPAPTRRTTSSLFTGTPTPLAPDTRAVPGKPFDRAQAEREIVEQLAALPLWQRRSA